MIPTSRCPDHVKNRFSFSSSCDCYIWLLHFYDQPWNLHQPIYTIVIAIFPPTQLSITHPTPHYLYSKGTWAHLCAGGNVDLKRRCGWGHFWRIAILWHQEPLWKKTTPQLCHNVMLFQVRRHGHKAHTICLWRMGMHSKTPHNRMNSPSVRYTYTVMCLLSLSPDIITILSALCCCSGDARRWGVSPPTPASPKGTLLNHWCSSRWSLCALSPPPTLCAKVLTCVTDCLHHQTSNSAAWVLNRAKQESGVLWRGWMK